MADGFRTVGGQFVDWTRAAGQWELRTVTAEGDPAGHLWAHVADELVAAYAGRAADWRALQAHLIDRVGVPLPDEARQR